MHSGADIAQAIMTLISARGMGKTICPSEVARHMSPSDWRPLMPQIREAARSLQVQGRIRVTQAGQDVNPMHVHGPIRLGLPPS
ncbi:DUF3253 domain-containing protein [Prosthecobacter sp. SYSU 5D2]|uniref:DUF3253 domain-containing protein n=1 Tax=Prosthecobacter sp. SYSU 5D2 TaxID=3134134 RepID=UPI0031FE8577